MEMRSAYRELATPCMFMLTLSLVFVIAGLVSLWDPMEMRRRMSGKQMAGFVALLGAFDFALCYANGILVLYLARFRSRVQAVAAFVVAAVALSVPCTVVFYGWFDAPFGGGAPARILYAVSAASALWGAALTAYILMLRIERRQALTSRRGMPPHLVASSDERAGSLTDPATSEGGAVPVPESPEAAKDGSPKSLLPRESPASVALSDASRAGRPQASETRTAPRAGESFAERDKPVADQGAPRGLEALNGDVIYVQVSGHYIDVVTTTGSAVLLMRLADAMAALGERGMQVHRSYWVAFRHMRRLIRRDHRMVLRLSDGQEVPVSRPHVRSVRDRIKQLLESRSF